MARLPPIREKRWDRRWKRTGSRQNGRGIRFLEQSVGAKLTAFEGCWVRAAGRTVVFEADRLACREAISAVAGGLAAYPPVPVQDLEAEVLDPEAEVAAEEADLAVTAQVPEGCQAGAAD